MIINRDNYEIYLVDYAEGNLTAEQTDMVKAFLLLNPDIAAEFELFNNPLVFNDNEITADKDQLYKIPFENEQAGSNLFQQSCIEYIENIMPDKQKQLFEQTIANNIEKKAECDEFKKTIIKPEDIFFDEKLLTKKQPFNHVINNNNITEYCIAKMEGWLDINGEIALANYIKTNPTAENILCKVYNTRLTPDMSIVFENKASIKKLGFTQLVKKHFIQVAAAAAVIVWGTLYVLNQPVNQIESQIAKAIPVQKTQTLNKITNIDSSNTNKSLINTINKTKQNNSKNTPVFEIDNLPNKQEHKNYLKKWLVEPIKPIMAKTVECINCEKNLVAAANLNQLQMPINKTIENEQLLTDNQNQQLTQKSFAKQVARVGYNTINRVTDGSLSITENTNGNTTKISINTKYFAIEKNIKTNRY